MLNAMQEMVIQIARTGKTLRQIRIPLHIETRLVLELNALSADEVILKVGDISGVPVIRHPFPYVMFVMKACGNCVLRGKEECGTLLHPTSGPCPKYVGVK